ncbi:MAG: hypothetical protein ABL989_05960 [Gammaproteobacteria bacterium]
MSHSDTHRLTRASLELSSRDERRRRAVTWVTVAALLLVAAGGTLYLSDPRLRNPGAALFGAADALEKDNATLRAELERLRAEFDMEKATRAELNRESVELHARINELNNRLEFLTGREARELQPR